MNRESKTYTIAFTFIYTFLFIFVITLAFMFSKDRIELNQRIRVKKSVLDAMGLSYINDTQADEIYDKEIEKIKIEDDTIYSATIKGNKVYLIYFSGNALWGTINGVLAVNEDISTIVGMRITSHNETPGLGGRVAEEWYMEEFSGEKIPSGALTFVRNQGNPNYDHTDGKVDVITGATRTSESLEKIINDTLNKLQSYKASGKL